MNLSPLSLNFNYQTKNLQKAFTNQLKLSQLTTDAVSFKSKEVIVQRQRAEELLGLFEKLQETRKDDIDWKYSRIDKSIMDEQDIVSIIETVGQYDDLSKKLLDSCTPASLYHKDDRKICFEIAKKQPNAAQNFLCRREFYAKDGKQHRPIYFASTTQEIKDLLGVSTSRRVYGLQSSDVDLVNKECTRQDCLDLIGLAEQDHELTYILHRPVGEKKGLYAHIDPLYSRLEMSDFIAALDKFDGMTYKSSILSERAEYLGVYIKEQIQNGTLTSNKNCSDILNHVISSMSSEQTLPQIKNNLYENCIAPVMVENSKFIDDLLAAKVEEDSMSLTEVEKLKAYFDNCSNSEK